MEIRYIIVRRTISSIPKWPNETLYRKHRWQILCYVHRKFFCVHQIPHNCFFIVEASEYSLSVWNLKRCAASDNGWGEDAPTRCSDGTEAPRFVWIRPKYVSFSLSDSRVDSNIGLVAFFLSLWFLQPHVRPLPLKIMIPISKTK